MLSTSEVSAVSLLSSEASLVTLELVAVVELVAEEELPLSLPQAAMLKAMVAAIARASIPVSIFFMMGSPLLSNFLGHRPCPFSEQLR